MNLPNLPYAHMAQVAQHGSPALLTAVGRAFGFGQAERAALTQGKIPGWLWLTLGLGVGVVAGVRAYREWPDKFPSWVKGT